MIVSSARNQSEMLRMLSGCILREQHQISRKNLTRMLIENIFFMGVFALVKVAIGSELILLFSLKVH